jgi:nucleoside-diphosphate-sugar epimerase
MTGRRILLTGASGCIGHYLSEALIQHIQHNEDELFLIIRDPKKFRLAVPSNPKVHIVQADLRDVGGLRDLLATIHTAVLVATGWGDAVLDVTKTLELIQTLDPQVCQQVIYFSTASLLGRDGNVLPEALSIGTDYIRAKAQCYEKLLAMDLGFPVLTLFPTLVLGGDHNKPYSHLSAGLPEVMKWSGLLRFLKTEGSCHFIHAQDIATVVLQLIQHPELAPDRKLVLGNPVITVNEAITELCRATNQRIYFQLSLTPWLIDGLIRIFKIQMGAWDYFCLSYRHFYYQNPISPWSFGLQGAYPTLQDVLLPCASGA